MNKSRLFRLFSNHRYEFRTHLSSENTNKPERPMYTPENPVSIDNPPTTCCMSGCANCVYIEWAEALTKEMAKCDPTIAKKIFDSVEDPSMRAFLQIELKNLGIIP